MTTDLQRANQMRSSQIRNILRAYYQLSRNLVNPNHEHTLRLIVDEMLAYRDAETITERNIRRGEFNTRWIQHNISDEELKQHEKPWGGKKQYHMTLEDAKKYTRW